MTQRQQIRAPGAPGGASRPPDAGEAAVADASGGDADPGEPRAGGAPVLDAPRPADDAPEPGDAPATRGGAGPGGPGSDVPGALSARRPRGPRRRRAWLAAAVAAAVAAVAAGAVLTLDRGGDGRVRVEGAVPNRGSAPTSSPDIPVRPIPRQSPAQLVKMVTSEPTVPEAVKRHVRECGADGRHLTAQYGDLTKDGATDVLVNVRTCDTDVPIAVYAFSDRYGKVQMVFDAAPAPIAGVHGTIQDGDIVVTRTVYRDGRPAKGSDEHVRSTWNGQHFQFVAANGGSRSTRR